MNFTEHVRFDVYSAIVAYDVDVIGADDSGLELPVAGFCRIGLGNGLPIADEHAGFKSDCVTRKADNAFK